MHRSLIMILALAAASLCAMAGEPPPKPPGNDPAMDDAMMEAAAESHGIDRETMAEMSRMMRELQAEMQEAMKGLDPASQEGRTRMAEMQKKHMEKAIQTMNNAARAKVHRTWRSTLGMSDAEFAAVTPLINALDDLRMQAEIFSARPAMAGLMGGAQQDRMVLSSLTGRNVEPESEQFMLAMTKLNTLSASTAQATTTELETVVGETRRLRAAFRAKLAKAETDLRSVLTRAQEAKLVAARMLE